MTGDRSGYRKIYLSILNYTEEDWQRFLDSGQDGASLIRRSNWRLTAAKSMKASDYLRGLRNYLINHTARNRGVLSVSH